MNTKWYHSVCCFLLQVNKGEKVLVRTGTDGNGDVHGADYSTFSAFLLFPHA